MVDHWTNLESFVILIALPVIRRMKVSKNVFESLLGHGVSYSLVSDKLSTFPITLNSWDLINTHNAVYAKKNHHFFRIRLKFTTILLCVQVTLYNNQVYKFIEVGYFPKHVKGCTVFLHFLSYHFCFQFPQVSLPFHVGLLFSSK